jgi:hypothetical protein
MIEDAEIAIRFSQIQLGAGEFSVSSDPDSATLVAAVAEAIPAVKRAEGSSSQPISWSELVMQKREQWPIEYLLPGGAYIH